MRAGGGVRCWMAPEEAGLGGAAAGGACANASETDTDIRAISVGRIIISYFLALLFLKELAVVFVVLTDELVDFGEIRTQREAAHDGPRFLEHVGILNRGLVIQIVEVRSMKALDHVQRFGVPVAAGKLGL